MNRGEIREDSAMIGVGTFVRVDVFDVQNFPLRAAGLKENIIEAAAEESSAPGPAKFVGGSMSVLMDLPKGILPMIADILYMMRMFMRIEIAGDDG